jgi:hypothetical protein
MDAPPLDGYGSLHGIIIICPLRKSKKKATEKQILSNFAKKHHLISAKRCGILA